MLKSFFGGGSTIAYVMLAAAIGGVWLKYDLTMKANVKLELERDEWKSNALGSKNALYTQAAQANRQANSQKDLNDAKDAISSAPDSHHCGASEPIVVGFEWLREYRERRAESDND